MTAQPIGLSRNLAQRQVMRAVLMQPGGNDLDIAVWRSVSGVVNAWENRCPHRGMRLSHGFVRGESLACAYHGWHYNTEGFCHYIPAHPELTPPKTVRPVPYNVVEQAGLLWVDIIAGVNGVANSDATPVTLAPDISGIRTLTVDSDTESTVQAFTTVVRSATDRPTNHENTAPQHRVISDSPLILALEAGGVKDGIIIALQQPQPDRVNVHVLARETVNSNERVSISRWLEAVRRCAETQFTGDA